MAYEPMYEKITEKELNQTLRKQVIDAFNHISNVSIHVSEEDRERWDSGKGIKLADLESSGLMSSNMVKKLNSISDNANNYIHPKTEQSIGTYLLTTIDEYGHVIKGENPKLLDITVTSANKLGNYGPDSFAKITSPNFIGRPMAPTVDNATIGDNIATTKYVNNILNLAIEGTTYIHPESGITTSGLPDGFVFKSIVETYEDISTVYPNPSYGWVVQTKDTSIYYFYNGSVWQETTQEELKNKWSNTYVLVTVDRYGHIIKGENLKSLTNILFPVGSIFTTVLSTINPTELYGGTWNLLETSTSGEYKWARTA